MVIDNFNVLRTFGGPDKADPELVVDPDGVLPRAIALEGFKPIAGWRLQIVKNLGGVQQHQFAACDLEQIRRKALAHFVVEDGFGCFVPEALDHDTIVSWFDTLRKQIVSIDDTILEVESNWNEMHRSRRAGFRPRQPHHQAVAAADHHPGRLQLDRDGVRHRHRRQPQGPWRDLVAGQDAGRQRGAQIGVGRVGLGREPVNPEWSADNRLGTRSGFNSEIA
jgi:hypothetical protein